MKKPYLLALQPLFIVLLALINLSALCFVHPFSQNLSDLGNSLGHFPLLFLWSSSASLYFFTYTSIFIKKKGVFYPFARFLLFFICLLMILSICIPYDPFQFPIASKWHIRIAMLATISYVLFFFHLLTTLLNYDLFTFQKAFPPYCFLVVFDLLLYLLNGGVSTLLEISFTIGMSLYLYYLLRI